MNDQISTVMASAGLNKQDLARRIRVSASTVTRWTQAGADLPLSALRALAAGTNSNLLTLLYRPQDRQALLNTQPPSGWNTTLPPWAQAVSDTGLTQTLARTFPLETLTLPPYGHEDHPTTVHGWSLGHNTAENSLFWAVSAQDETTEHLQERLQHGQTRWPCMLSLLWDKERATGVLRLDFTGQPERPPAQLTPAGQLYYNERPGRREHQISALPGPHTTRPGHTPEVMLLGAPDPTSIIPTRQNWLCIDVTRLDPLQTLAVSLETLSREAARHAPLRAPAVLGDVLEDTREDHGGDLRRELASLCAALRNRPAARAALLYSGTHPVLNYTGWFRQRHEQNLPDFAPLALEQNLLWRPSWDDGVLPELEEPTPKTPARTWNADSWDALNRGGKTPMARHARDLNTPLYLIGASPATLLSLLNAGRKGRRELNAVTLEPYTEAT